MKLVCSPDSCSAYQYCEEEREEVQSGADVDRAAVVVGRLLVHCAEQLVKPGQLDVNVCTHKEEERGVSTHKEGEGVSTNTEGEGVSTNTEGEGCVHTHRGERVCPHTQRERVCPQTQRERDVSTHTEEEGCVHTHKGRGMCPHTKGGEGYVHTHRGRQVIRDGVCMYVRVCLCVVRICEQARRLYTYMCV